MELSATIPALLNRQTTSFGSETILRKKDRGIWNAIVWSKLDQHVREIGQGLCASGFGAREVAVLLANTRPDLVYVDLAVIGRGGISLALHPDDDPAVLQKSLCDTRATFAVVEGEEQLDKILSVREACPDLRRVVIIDMKGLRDFQDSRCLSLKQLIESGKGRSDWDHVTGAVTPDQTAALLRVSDGSYHAVTHARIMRQIAESGQTLDLIQGDERLVVLPMDDPTERVLGLYLALKYRIVSNYLENPETATENLREVKPAVFGANIEAWERLHARITSLAADATGLQKSLYQWAVKVGGRGGVTGILANFLVLRAIREELGFRNLRIAYVGDGVMPPETEQWACALGIKVRSIKPFQ